VLGPRKDHRDQALAVFHQRYSPAAVRVCAITDVLSDNCGVYSPPRNCWFILFSENPLPMQLQSSRFAAISKSTGEMVRDDLANDEG